MIEKKIEKKNLKFSFDVLYVKEWIYVMPTFQNVT